jgi:6-phosphogluconolactonase
MKWLQAVAWSLGATFGISHATAQTSFSGNVYTASNAVDRNEVLHFRVRGDGHLEPVASYPTGGTGTGEGLGNQGGIALSEDARFLFVVNAGSNELSVFERERWWASGGLTLRDRTPSGGVRPISVTVSGDFVYVLNAGDLSTPGKVAGFKLSRSGCNGVALEAIPGSERPLSGAMADPAQIGFSPDRRVLVVTEKGTQQILTFAFDAHTGTPSSPIFNPSSGMTPFGFAFSKAGTLVVSEAFGGMASALSSYAVAADGSLVTLSASVMAPGEAAACWVGITRNGRFAFTTNTGTSTTSSYRLKAGRLELLQASAAESSTPGPIDLALSSSDRWLFVLNSSGSVDTFSVTQGQGDVSLVRTSSLIGVPQGANGLLAD